MWFDIVLYSVVLNGRHVANLLGNKLGEGRGLYNLFSVEEWTVQTFQQKLQSPFLNRISQNGYILICKRTSRPKYIAHSHVESTFLPLKSLYQDLGCQYLDPSFHLKSKDQLGRQMFCTVFLKLVFVLQLLLTSLGRQELLRVSKI